MHYLQQAVCIIGITAWLSPILTQAGAVSPQKEKSQFSTLSHGPHMTAFASPSRSSKSDNDNLDEVKNHAVGDFLKGGRNSAVRTTRIKRTPTGFTARGIHEDGFDRDFGHFSPVKKAVKRRPEADAAGFYGDTFSGGFGEFETMKRADLPLDYYVGKRRPEMGAQGFHGDTFNQGFGEFDTMKRSHPYMNWMETAAKRRPEMTKSGFHGDVFNGGFGEFHPMRK